MFTSAAADYFSAFIIENGNRKLLGILMNLHKFIENKLSLAKDLTIDIVIKP